MKFLNKQGQEITLKRAENLPGYEVTLSEDVVIDSAVNNPFFKGINVLQLPKKLKGFRDNKDLQEILKPQEVNTGVQVKLDEGELAFFEPDKDLILSNKLILVSRIFGENEGIVPMFINYGLQKVRLKANTIVGTIFIQKNFS
ncbi:hypothetical protein [Weissella paramesenteroides]|jgi:dUTP pyrophosphatase|uniref:hypothetical protein n=1 Tax=Weissella paramesenteroides TaxID=1249 RepID=UPI002E7AF1F8|nr:hypothetical protein [Weissella paramesenteroides]WPQ68714.1 hypothetical protein QRX23_03730 [Weissella paramesenteroides]